MSTLIISVGGTPEPLVSSIREHRPASVVFFCSQDSVAMIGAIRAMLGPDSAAIRSHVVQVEDPQDLVHCYERALRCAEVALAGGRSAREVVVDFTGGTKAMAAALVLAMIGNGFSFSYVGGTARTEDGLGTVVTGTETIIRGGDPFLLFAVEERKRLAGFFRTYQFKAARAVAEALLARPLGEQDRLAFEMVRDLARGYELWERFEYQQALEKLGRCMTTWTIAVRANPSIRYAGVLPTLSANVRWLEALAQRTGGFTRADRALLPDLLANADRRAQEGSYDDGIVRLYRALELGAQVAVRRRLGCGTDRVPATAIPGSFRDQVRNRYREVEPGFFQLPLEGAYRLLAELGEPEGERFVAQHDAFRIVQHARNYSWLVHGMTPGTEGAYRDLRALVCEILCVGETVTLATLEEG